MDAYDRCNNLREKILSIVLPSVVEAENFSDHPCNYTKLDMCIWLWCEAKDCPWLSNSTPTLIVIQLHSMTEHVLGPYWWGCTASGLSRSWGSVSLSLYLMWSIMEINMWFFCVCVCVKNWAKFCSEYLKEQGLLGRTRHSWEYNIKKDL